MRGQAASPAPYPALGRGTLFCNSTAGRTPGMCGWLFLSLFLFFFFFLNWERDPEFPYMGLVLTPRGWSSGKGDGQGRAAVP